MLDTANLLILHTQLWMQSSISIDLANWRVDANGSHHNVLDADLLECGSTGCAIGHATANPVFKLQGFTWDAKLNQPILKTFCGEVDYPLNGWDAVASMFGLTDIETRCIFTQYNHEVMCNTLDDLGPAYYDVVRICRKIIGKVGSVDKQDDRTKILGRIRRHLKAKGHITTAQAKVLKQAEKQPSFVKV